MKKQILFITGILFIIVLSGVVNAVTDRTDLTYTSGSTKTIYYGLRALTKAELTLTEVGIDVECTADTVYLYNSSQGFLANSSISGLTAAFNYPLVKNTTYYFLTGSGGGSYIPGTNENPPFPIGRTNINYTGGWNGNDIGNRAYGITNITTTQDVIPPVISDVICLSSDPDDATEPYNTTGDLTPTFNFTTDGISECFISDSNSSWTGCTTTNATGEHICTIPFTKILNSGDDIVYLTCNDTSDNAAYDEWAVWTKEEEPAVEAVGGIPIIGGGIIR